MILPSRMNIYQGYWSSLSRSSSCEIFLVSSQLAPHTCLQLLPSIKHTLKITTTACLQNWRASLGKPPPAGRAGHKHFPGSSSFAHCLDDFVIDAEVNLLFVAARGEVCLNQLICVSHKVVLGLPAQLQLGLVRVGKEVDGPVVARRSKQACIHACGVPQPILCIGNVIKTVTHKWLT